MLILIYFLIALSVYLFVFSIAQLYSQMAESQLGIAMTEKHEERKGVVKIWLVFSKFFGEFFLSILINPDELQKDSKNKGLIKKYYDSLDRMLTSAGKPYSILPSEIFGSMFLGASFGLISGFYLGLMTGYLEGGMAILTFVGFVLPLSWLKSKKDKRQLNIFRTLPYAIDLMTLSVEAGMDFTVALRKISEKLKKNDLGEEFIQVISEISLGKSRSESLRDMAHRVNTDDMMSFANAVIQADELGSSMGPVLRIQADQLRQKRSLVAEEKAMKAPVKLIFPIVLFCLPSVLLIMGGIIFVSHILPMMGGR